LFLHTCPACTGPKLTDCPNQDTKLCYVKVVFYWNHSCIMCRMCYTLSRMYVYFCYIVRNNNNNNHVELFILSVLDVFTKLRKVTIIFVMPVCPSAWNTWASNGWILTKFYIWGFFFEICHENLSSLKSDKYNGHFTWISKCICLKWSEKLSNVESSEVQ